MKWFRFLCCASSLMMNLINGCCASAPEPDAQAGYLQALASTDPAVVDTVREGSPEEKAALDRFVDFYRVFSADRVKEQVRNVYAADAYFRDPFKAVKGIEALEDYFLRSTESFNECTFDFQDISPHQGNYYVRWIMNLKRNPGPRSEVIQAVGMSHIRFNRSGQVIFHQDYWDAAGAVYEHVPVIGRILKKIRRSI